MEALGTLIILAVVVERIAELLLGYLGGLKLSSAEMTIVSGVVHIVLGILGAAALQVDLFGELGLHDAYPVLGVILSGIAVVGGSTYVMQLISAAKAGASPK